MPDVKTLYVVSYDTPNPNRRSRLIRRLQRFGERSQYSVFEVWLKPKDIPRLLKLLQTCVDPTEDRFALYPTHAETVWRMGVPLSETQPSGDLIV